MVIGVRVDMIRLGLVFLFLGALLAGFGGYGQYTQFQTKKFDQEFPAPLAAFELSQLGELQTKWTAPKNDACCVVSIRMSLRGTQSDRKTEKQGKDEYSLRFDIPAGILVTGESGQTLLNRAGSLSGTSFNIENQKVDTFTWSISDQKNVGPKGGSSRIEIPVGTISPHAGDKLHLAARLNQDPRHGVTLEKGELLVREIHSIDGKTQSFLGSFAFGIALLGLGFLLFFLGAALQVIRMIVSLFGLLVRKPESQNKTT